MVRTCKYHEAEISATISLFQATTQEAQSGDAVEANKLNGLDGD